MRKSLPTVLVYVTIETVELFSLKIKERSLLLYSSKTQSKCKVEEPERCILMLSPGSLFFKSISY